MARVHCKSEAVLVAAFFCVIFTFVRFQVQHFHNMTTNVMSETPFNSIDQTKQKKLDEPGLFYKTHVGSRSLSPAKWHDKHTYLSSLGMLGTTQLNFSADHIIFNNGYMKQGRE